jgi:hypothetical protein
MQIESPIKRDSATPAMHIAWSSSSWQMHPTWGIIAYQRKVESLWLDVDAWCLRCPVGAAR